MLSPMDPKLIYWTGATLNMAVLLGLAVRGAGRARSGQVASHRRFMLSSVALVLAFVVSYLFKLLFLGREHLDTWTSGAVWTLRFHELCVFTMLISGGLAAWRGIGLARTRALLDSETAPEPRPEELRSHRLAGRVAVSAAALGLLSAGAVLGGMYGRAAG